MKECSLKPYQRGLYAFGECFYADERGYLEDSANEEKHQIALVMDRFARVLNERHYIFGGTDPLLWLEPGFGDGASTVKYIRSIAPWHKAGFVIYGSDIMPQSVERASANLENIPGIPVRIAEIGVRDAFTGANLALALCDFAMISHMVYHAQMQINGGMLGHDEVSRRMDRFISNVMDSLKDDGLMLGFHESRDSHLSGTLGRLFGSAMPDAAEQLEASAARLGYEMVSLPLHPKLHFPPLSDADLNAFEDVGNWQDYAPLSDQASWLKKFLFAVQASDGEKTGGGVGLQREGRLPEAIRFTRKLLEDNDGAIIVHAKMQAIPKNSERIALLRESFDAIEAGLPEIDAKVTRAMKNAAISSPHPR